MWLKGMKKMKNKKYWLLGLLASVLLLPQHTVLAGSYQVIQRYPSDRSWFTQGLELNDDNKLLIGSGRYGQSKLGELDLTTGTIKVLATLPSNLFGEGITITQTALWQLTYKEHQALKRNRQTYEVEKIYHYDGEGWGIAYDQTRQVLWMTNGSAILQKRDPETFDLLAEIPITYQGKPLERVNELESVDGYLYANVWQTNQIIKLDPMTGVVQDTVDLTPLLQQYQLLAQPHTTGAPDYLNGIAHIDGNRFYITGKLYPDLFEVELELK